MTRLYAKEFDREGVTCWKGSHDGKDHMMERVTWLKGSTIEGHMIEGIMWK